MAETKEGLLDTAARAVKAVLDFTLGKKAEDTKLAAEPQSLKTKDGDPIEVDETGAVTSGQADGDYILADGSTATITDGKLAEVKPADATEAQGGDSKEAESVQDGDKSTEADDEPKNPDNPGEEAEKQAEDKPVTQADLQAVLAAIADLKKEFASGKEASKAELSAEVTKLSVELEELKRQPAVGKQGAPTYTREKVDMSKLSVADRALYAIQTLK